MQKKQILDILNAALASGGDYSELFFEDTVSKDIVLEDGNVSKTSTGNVFGCGIRIFKKINAYMDIVTMYLIKTY